MNSPLKFAVPDTPTFMVTHARLSDAPIPPAHNP